MKFVQINKMFLLCFLFFSCNETLHSDCNLKTNDSLNKVLLNNTCILNIDTNKYKLWKIDFDKDGDLDKIFSNVFLEGDSLFVYENIGKNKYEKSLSTYNFSDDGLFIVDSIGVIVDTSLANFIIYTHFNGAGGMKKNIFLKYVEEKKWKISLTTTESVECNNQNNYFIKKCTLVQNLYLQDTTDWNNYRSFDLATDKECIIEELIIK